MFRVRICSDLDHEEVVADICWNDKTLATINQDQGLENLAIELFSPPDQDSWNLPFNDLIKAMINAQEKLNEMQKIPEDIEGKGVVA